MRGGEGREDRGQNMGYRVSNDNTKCDHPAKSTVFSNHHSVSFLVSTTAQGDMTGTYNAHCAICGVPLVYVGPVSRYQKTVDHTEIATNPAFPKQCSTVA